MKIGIAFKLFCAILGAGIVMATAMGVASRISFQRGFLGYLNELETQRLGVLTSALADVYREQAGETGSDKNAGQDAWAFLRGQEDDWRSLVRASDRSFRASRDQDGRGDPARRAAPARSARAGETAPATRAEPSPRT